MSEIQRDKETKESGNEILKTKDIDHKAVIKYSFVKMSLWTD